jgi:PII-like signaling protein
MTMIGERILFRAYLLSTDHAHFAPTYERLVQRAGKRRLAGATVLRGIFGFGSRGILQPSDWHLVNSTPVIVEIVDTAERIAEFIRQEVHGVVTHGMITLERAGVMMYRHRAATDPRPPLELPGRIQGLSTVPQIDGSEHMKVNEDGVLLRVFAGESDRFEGRPLYEAVVHKAKELGLSGATVLRGSMGFGANSILHTTKVLELSTDLPIVIEMVDSEANIRKLLPHLDLMVKEGMITMESVRVLLYRHNPDDAPPAAQPS